MIESRKFKPQASCLCVELGLGPEQFVRVVSSYLKNPRVIVKDGEGSHKVLHVTEDGTQKDHSMIKQVMNDSMLVAGSNITDILRRTHGKSFQPDTSFTATRMQNTLNEFHAVGRVLKHEVEPYSG
jgi:hypothetical protein